MSDPLLLISLISFFATVLIFLILTRFDFSWLRRHTLTLLPMAIGMGAAIVATSTVIFVKPDQKADLLTLQTEIEAEKVNARIDQILAQQDRLSQALAQPVVSTSGVDETALKKIDARLIEIEDAVNNINNIIATDPQRLVSVPILLREVESIRAEMKGLKEQQTLQNKTLVDGVTEAKGQARWILGTLGIGLLAVVVPLVRSVFAKN